MAKTSAAIQPTQVPKFAFVSINEMSENFRANKASFGSRMNAWRLELSRSRSPRRSPLKSSFWNDIFRLSFAWCVCRKYFADFTLINGTDFGMQNTSSITRTKPSGNKAAMSLWRVPTAAKASSN